MLRVLLDQKVPQGIRRALGRHEVRTAVEQGWETFKNGDLLSAAETAKFDVFVTYDRNVRYQQNLGDAASPSSC